MFKKTTIRLAGLIFLASPILFPLVSYAADTSGEVGYNIQAVIPENQGDKTKSFFDLRMTPGQKQTVSIMINNTSNQDSKYQININQAYTSDQGFIDYSESKKAQENNYPYKINTIAKTDSKVDVAKNSSREVPITLTMPEEKYDGQILAAIQVVKDSEETKSGISNNYGYLLGLKLTESDTEVHRQLKLKKVEPAESFGKTSIAAVLENPTMDAYGHLKYEATVKNSATNKVVRTVSYDKDMQMAPNSRYRFAIDWEKKRLEAGDYSLHLKVSDAKNNVWVFDRKFTISNKQAKEVNAATIDAATEDSLPTWVFIVIGILLAVILLGIIWLILAKWKKDKEKM